MGSSFEACLHDLQVRVVDGRVDARVGGIEQRNKRGVVVEIGLGNRQLRAVEILRNRCGADHVAIGKHNLVNARVDDEILNCEGTHLARATQHNDLHQRLLALRC